MESLLQNILGSFHSEPEDKNLGGVRFEASAGDAAVADWGASVVLSVGKWIHAPISIFGPISFVQ